MKKSRRKFKPEFKAQVALAAIQERETLSELAKHYKVHPVQITKWKKEFLQNAGAAFEKDAGDRDADADGQELYNGLKTFLTFYNHEKTHHRIGRVRPADIYLNAA